MVVYYVPFFASSSTSFIFICYSVYKNVFNCFWFIQFKFSWFETQPLFNSLHLLQNRLCTWPTGLSWLHTPFFYHSQSSFSHTSNGLLAHPLTRTAHTAKIGQSEIMLTKKEKQWLLELRALSYIWRNAVPGVSAQCSYQFHVLRRVV